MQPGEAACFYPWIADPEVIRYSLSAFQSLNTPAQIDHWFAATLREEKSLTLGIYLQETNALIGYAGLSNLSAANRSGEYFILIGEKAHWGKGVGTAVTSVLAQARSWLVPTASASSREPGCLPAVRSTC